jgi:tRNA-Thr(GGU) m(6)t(6)A37 methyltransferase TsaA
LFELKAIGTVYTPFVEREGTPIQPTYAADVKGHALIDPEYVEALGDLDGFEHIWLLYVFDRSHGWSARVVPFRDTVEHGLFATRAPRRPNPIGMSVVRLEAIAGNRLELSGVDVLDGTPLLDIKPYVPEFDCRPNSRAGWLDAKRSTREQADGRFE